MKALVSLVPRLAWTRNLRKSVHGECYISAEGWVVHNAAKLVQSLQKWDSSSLEKTISVLIIECVIFISFSEASVFKPSFISEVVSLDQNQW
jgi:hypothetical protein